VEQRRSRARKINVFFSKHIESFFREKGLYVYARSDSLRPLQSDDDKRNIEIVRFEHHEEYKKFIPMEKFTITFTDELDIQVEHVDYKHKNKIKNLSNDPDYLPETLTQKFRRLKKMLK
jgi:hypothetical protein